LPEDDLFNAGNLETQLNNFLTNPYGSKQGEQLRQNQTFKVETPENYIEAYTQILMTCANNFINQCPIYTYQWKQYHDQFQLPHNTSMLKEQFLLNVKNNFSAYMRQWGYASNIVSGLTMPRKGSHRDSQNIPRYQHLKRNHSKISTVNDD